MVTNLRSSAFLKDKRDYKNYNFGCHMEFKCYWFVYIQP